GSGVDVPYPKGSRQLIERAARDGAVVSEYAPGVEAEPFRFPARNRIVAALGRALVVVEGAKGSGSMISVDHALDRGREVFEVRGLVRGVGGRYERRLPAREIPSGQPRQVRALAPLPGR